MIPQAQPVQSSGTAGSGIWRLLSGGAWLATIVNCLMVAVVAGLFWFPVRRMFANVEVN